MNELLLILFPLAVFSGWWMGRAETKQTKDGKADDYLKGLSYLLEDETDKAIEIFFRIANIDEKTIENQITLGNLFRQKGEVDRALHIHSSLEKKQSLSSEGESKLSNSLAEDYLAAGIMNKAEEYFLRVNDIGGAKLRDKARQALIDIYSGQKQWDKAIDVASDIDPFHKNKNLQKKVAYFYCEIAKNKLHQIEVSTEEEIEKNDFSFAIDDLKMALQCDPSCVRASIKLGKIAHKQKKYIEAISSFQSIEGQRAIFLMEVLDDMESCYVALKQEEEWKIFLINLYKKMPNSVLLLRLVDWMKQHESESEALELLIDNFSKNTEMMGIKAYLDLSLNSEKELSNEEIYQTLHLVKSEIDKLLAPTLSYRCNECGFRGKELNWQCPGCRQWETSKVISGVTIKENSF